VSAPPLAPLRDVVRRLERAGIRCALGGSGLLAALGLARLVHDWDLTLDGSLAEATRALADGDLVLHGPSGIHADHKLVTARGRVEVIVGHAVAHRGGVCRLPALVSRRWRDVPLASPEVWAVAYALLGRPAKSDALFEHLARRGADREARVRLLAEPLPSGLARRLRALPPRNA
jgi:hypothetical protein